jgi:mannose-6-phosphate isomerase-like protein (cupin superfamily)
MRRIRLAANEEPLMRAFETVRLRADPDATAPDGTAVRLLLALAGGSFAHFELPAGAVSHAVAHKTVEEIWYFLSGRGEIWRKGGAEESVVEVGPGVSLTIPLGTAFQFRAHAEAPLAFLAVTMPPWPGAQEADLVAGRWAATVAHS